MSDGDWVDDVRSHIEEAMDYCRRALQDSAAPLWLTPALDALDYALDHLPAPEPEQPIVRVKLDEDMAQRVATIIEARIEEQVYLDRAQTERLARSVTADIFAALTSSLTPPREVKP